MNDLILLILACAAATYVTRFIGHLILSRLRHFQTVCPVVPWRSARTQAGSLLAWIAALTLGVVIACLCSLICIVPSLPNTPQNRPC